MKNCKCNKLNPKIPPDISGEFNIIAQAYGNLNGKVIPLDKPLKLSGKMVYEQNELFVKDSMEIPNIPKRESRPGVWKKKYNKNLKFAGWDLYMVDTINDNGYIIFSPTCVKNNKVMIFTGIYIESGYMKGNPLQTPLVNSVSGVRVCKK